MAHYFRQVLTRNLNIEDPKNKKKKLEEEVEMQIPPTPDRGKKERKKNSEDASFCSPLKRGFLYGGVVTGTIGMNGADMKYGAMLAMGAMVGPPGPWRVILASWAGICICCCCGGFCCCGVCTRGGVDVLGDRYIRRNTEVSEWLTKTGSFF